MTSLALVPSPAETALVQLHDLRARLAVPDLELDEAVAARDRAVVLRAYAHTAKLGLQVANEAVELKIRAERRAGGLLHDMLAAGPKIKRALPNGTLERAGITAMQSSCWQLIGQIPDPEFEARLDATKTAGRQLSSAAFVRAARQFLRQPGQGGNGQVSPTLRRLRRALELLRDVRELRAPAEVELARAVVAIGESWAVVLEPKAAPGRQPIDRQVTCLMCGRERPSSKPPRCLACGGAWYA